MSDTVKPYELTFEHRPQYILARVKAETVDAKMVVAYMLEILEKSREFGQSKVIVERDIPAVLSTSDAFFVGAELAENRIGTLQVAYVDNRSSNTEDMEFALMTSNNRGSNFKLFKGIPDAEAWLEAPQSKNRLHKA